MSIMSRLRFLPALLLLILLFPFNPVTGQVKVDISAEKVIIEGKAFYLHTVLKGQTAYSISKAYGITVEELEKSNPGVASGTKEGAELKIQVIKSTGSQAQTKPQVSPQSLPADVISKGIIYHYIADDETVYSLSKRYNVAQADILRSNPGLDINFIPVGTRIAIPSSSSAQQSGKEGSDIAAVDNPTNEQKTEDGKFMYHKVLKGETFSSLSRDNNVSLRDIKRANKGLLCPKEGEYIMIPLQSLEGEIEPSEQNITPPENKADVYVADTQKNIQPEESKIERIPLSNMEGSVRVAVLLPFFLDDRSQLTYADSSGSGYPFLELYEGMLLAADSLRSLGLKIELDVYDTGDDTLTTQQLISSGRLDNADLILGPVYSSNLEDVAVFSSEHNIPVVSPVPLIDQNILSGKPSLFKICPSYIVEQNVIANYVAAIPDANVVLLYSDSLMYNPETVAFRNKLTRVFWDKGDTTGFREFFFSGRLIRKSNLYKDARALEEQMVKDKENVIIIATTDIPKVSAAITLLHNLSKRYNISVTATSEIREFETIDLKYLYDLEMMFPSENYIDYSRPEVNAFVRSFYTKFKTEPNEENFAWRGFDMAYYFIAATAIYGRSFYQDFNSFVPLLASYDFRFSRILEQDGFENQNMFIMQYKPDRTITVTSFRDFMAK